MTGGGVAIIGCGLLTISASRDRPRWWAPRSG